MAVTIKELRAAFTADTGKLQAGVRTARPLTKNSAVSPGSPGSLDFARMAGAEAVIRGLLEGAAPPASPPRIPETKQPLTVTFDQRAKEQAQKAVADAICKGLLNGAILMSGPIRDLQSQMDELRARTAH